MKNKLTADASGLPPITDEEAGYIKGMLMRGDRNHDIAAFWGRNPARIADIKQWRTFAHVKPLQMGCLHKAHTFKQNKNGKMVNEQAGKICPP